MFGDNMGVLDDTEADSNSVLVLEEEVVRSKVEWVRHAFVMQSSECCCVGSVRVVLFSLFEFLLSNLYL